MQPEPERDQAKAGAELETMVALPQALEERAGLATMPEQTTRMTQEPLTERLPMAQAPKPGPEKKELPEPFRSARERRAEDCYAKPAVVPVAESWKAQQVAR